MPSVSRRGFLAGSALATTALSATAQTSFQGRVSVTTVPNESVTVALTGAGSWTLDVKAFAGNPSLSVIKQGTSTITTLKGGRLAGTTLACDITATIPANAAENLSITINLGGRSMTTSAPIGSWLAGRAPLEQAISQGDANAVAAKVGITNTFRMLADGQLSYRRDGSFLLQGRGVIRSHAMEFGTSYVVFHPVRRSAKTLVDGRDLATTSISGRKTGTWPGNLKLVSQSGWEVSGPVDSFEDVIVERHEGTAVATRFIGSGALSVSMPNHTTISATDTDLTMIGDGNDDVHFSANLNDRGQWIHHEGVSTKVFPSPGERFALSMDRNGQIIGAPNLQTRGGGVGGKDSGITIPAGEKGHKVDVRTEKPPAEQTKRPIIEPGKPKPLGPQSLPKNPVVVTTTVEVPYLDVVRKADQLSLRFELINFKLVATTGQEATLVYETRERPSYIVVEFPPQSVAEATNELHAKTEASNPSRLVFFVPRDRQPIKVDLTSAGGLLDWNGWSLAVDPVAFDFRPQTFIIEGGWVYPIVGGYTMPPKVGIGYIKVSEAQPSIFDKVANLFASILPSPEQAQRIKPSGAFKYYPKPGRGVPVVKPVQPQVDPTKIIPGVPNGRTGAPMGWITDIELPAYVHISPDQNAKFIHLKTADAKIDSKSKSSKSALWHTRLAVQIGAQDWVESSDDGDWYYTNESDGRHGPFHSASSLKALVRVIDSSDYDKAIPGADSLPLDRNQRKELVDTFAHRALDAKSDCPPFIVDRLMLTSIGGYLKGSWDWPESRGVNPYNVLAWKQWTNLGRDQSVYVRQAGFLYPTGQRADKITVTERHFIKNSFAGAGTVAMLIKKEFLVMVKPRVDLESGPARAFGFTSVTCHTKISPPLNFGAGALVDLATNKPFAFPMSGVDMDGHVASWHQSCLWMEWSEGLAYNVSPDLRAHFDVDFAGHPLAFVPSAKPGDASVLPCDSMSIFGGNGVSDPVTQLPAFRPAMKSAKVRLHAADQFLGSDASLGAVEVAFDPTYVAQGLTGGLDVFMSIKSGVDASFKDGTKFGGLIQPNSKFEVISRLHGPIPAGGSSIPKTSYMSSIGDPVASITPDVVAPDLGKLMGVVSIWDLLPDPIDLLNDGGADAPKIKVAKVHVDDTWGVVGSGTPKSDLLGAVASFSWHPKLKDWPSGGAYKVFSSYTDVKDNKNPLGGNHAQLVIDTLLYQIKDPPSGSSIPSGSSYIVNAGIYNFVIDAFDQLLIKVQQISFGKKTGASPEIHIDIEDLHFQNILGFVDSLESLISTKPKGYHYSGEKVSEVLASTRPEADGFSITPIIDVGAEGLTAGISVSVPTISVGVVAIMNISVLSELILPWFGDELTFRFDFCTKAAPFRVCVYAIAGGGFLGIELTPGGLKTIEGSIEFGACVALNFGVACGCISLMAGFYFKYTMGQGSTLTGYVRLNGEVSVLGIISASITMELDLSYQTATGVLSGDATFTVTISLFCFHKSVHIHAHKEFAGSSASSSIGDAYASLDAAPAIAPDTTLFQKLVTQDQFSQYCSAFGA